MEELLKNGADANLVRLNVCKHEGICIPLHILCKRNILYTGTYVFCIISSTQGPEPPVLVASDNGFDDIAELLEQYGAKTD